MLLDKERNLCYCRNCHAMRGDLDHYPRGNPPKTYALPIGWYRIGLRTSISKDVFEKWYRAYLSFPFKENIKESIEEMIKTYTVLRSDKKDKKRYVTPSIKYCEKITQPRR